jgi:hypothetical protein
MLDPAFDTAVLACAARALPNGFDISPDAPATFDALATHWRDTGRVCVWDGASDSTIFGSPSVNYAFRAWHDWHHIAGQYPFTREGERLAMLAQQRDIRTLYRYTRQADWFCRILECEIVGQFDYAAKHGFFPVDQAAFARHYLGIT